MGNLCCNKGDERGFYDRPRRTLAPNMKNFKNLKFVTDINALYVIGEELGKGSFGSVYRATRKGMNTQWAIKSIKKRSLHSNPMLP